MTGPVVATAALLFALLVVVVVLGIVQRVVAVLRRTSALLEESPPELRSVGGRWNAAAADARAVRRRLDGGTEEDVDTDPVAEGS